MASDQTVTKDKTAQASDGKAEAVTSTTLVNQSLQDCRSANSAMKGQDCIAVLPVVHVGDSAPTPQNAKVQAQEVHLGTQTQLKGAAVQPAQEVHLGTLQKHPSSDAAARAESAVNGDKVTHREDLTGTPGELSKLTDARAKLKSDALKYIAATKDGDAPGKDKELFLKDMDNFEKRAKTQPLSANEVADTYVQLSKCLEATDGATSKENRVLAVESFAHHMAEPTKIDQGWHYTCNVTALEERLVTRNPAKAAEIVSTMATTGSWKAPDGKEIKIDKGSLQPGREEKDNPTLDKNRSYATQLMNLALMNDIEQRRNPPIFYSQESPTLGQTDSGERLRMQDGRIATNRDFDPKGDLKPALPSVSNSVETAQLGGRIFGDDKFVIANPNFCNQEPVMQINSSEELKSTLTSMKEAKKFPVLIVVNANSPELLEHENGKGVAGHMMSVTGYDAATGKVTISNQWGEKGDGDMTVEQLYAASDPTRHTNVAAPRMVRHK